MRFVEAGSMTINLVFPKCVYTILEVKGDEAKFVYWEDGVRSNVLYAPVGVFKKDDHVVHAEDAR